jgi:hypothetical protein
MRDGRGGGREIPGARRMRLIHDPVPSNFKVSECLA